MSVCLRWPGKKYTIVCPPPTPKKTREEAKETKALKKKAMSGLHDDPEEEGEERKGVLYYEYDLMFHYLLASLFHYLLASPHVPLPFGQTLRYFCWAGAAQVIAVCSVSLVVLPDIFFWKVC